MKLGPAAVEIVRPFLESTLECDRGLLQRRALPLSRSPSTASELLRFGLGLGPCKRVPLARPFRTGISECNTASSTRAASAALTEHCAREMPTWFWTTHPRLTGPFVEGVAMWPVFRHLWAIQVHR